MRLIRALLIGVPATTLMTVPALAQTSGDRWHMMGAWGWGGMIFGPILMIVFIAVVVVVQDGDPYQQLLPRHVAAL